MDKNRYKQIAERNKDNKMMLCYEVFCEEKKQIPYQVFMESFPQWITLMQMSEMKIGIPWQQGLDRVVEFLNKKYEKN